MLESCLADTQPDSKTLETRKLCRPVDAVVCTTTCIVRLNDSTIATGTDRQTAGCDPMTLWFLGRLASQESWSVNTWLKRIRYAFHDPVQCPPAPANSSERCRVPRQRYQSQFRFEHALHALLVNFASAECVRTFSLFGTAPVVDYYCCDNLTTTCSPRRTSRTI